MSRTGWHWVSEAGVLMVAAETALAAAATVARRTARLFFMVKEVAFMVEGMMVERETMSSKEDR